MQVVVRINGKLRDQCAEINENNGMNITKLNLDVTTMMAFVSNLTCETCDLSFSQPILNDQACRERVASTKLFLDELFKGILFILNLLIETERLNSKIFQLFLHELHLIFTGKELIACETARESFLSILDIVGGPNERMRGKQFLSSIKILPDLEEMEEISIWSENTFSHADELRLGKKIQKRTYKIFTFGMFHKAMTVTANKGAIEAAKMQVYTYTTRVD